MFGQSTVKNRRLNAKEYETELEASKIFCHPPRQYLLDIPYYPMFPPAPVVPYVNFNLNFKI